MLLYLYIYESKKVSTQFLVSTPRISKHEEKKSSKLVISDIGLSFVCSESLEPLFAEKINDQSLFHNVIIIDLFHSIFLYVVHVGILISFNFWNIDKARSISSFRSRPIKSFIANTLFLFQTMTFALETTPNLPHHIFSLFRILISEDFIVSQFLSTARALEVFNPNIFFNVLSIIIHTSDKYRITILKS